MTKTFSNTTPTFTFSEQLTWRNQRLHFPNKLSNFYFSTSCWLLNFTPWNFKFLKPSLLLTQSYLYWNVFLLLFLLMLYALLIIISWMGSYLMHTIPSQIPTTPFQCSLFEGSVQFIPFHFPQRPSIFYLWLKLIYWGMLGIWWIMMVVIWCCSNFLIKARCKIFYSL